MSLCGRLHGRGPGGGLGSLPSTDVLIMKWGGPQGLGVVGPLTDVQSLRLVTRAPTTEENAHR